MILCISSEDLCELLKVIQEAKDLTTKKSIYDAATNFLAIYSTLLPIPAQDNTVSDDTEPC